MQTADERRAKQRVRAKRHRIRKKLEEVDPVIVLPAIAIRYSFIGALIDTGYLQHVDSEDPACVMSAVSAATRDVGAGIAAIVVRTPFGTER